MNEKEELKIKNICEICGKREATFYINTHLICDECKYRKFPKTKSPKRKICD